MGINPAFRGLKVMPSWRKLFTSLSLQMHRFNTGIMYVGFLVEQVVMVVVFFS